MIHYPEIQGEAGVIFYNSTIWDDGAGTVHLLMRGDVPPSGKSRLFHATLVDGVVKVDHQIESWNGENWNYEDPRWICERWFSVVTWDWKGYAQVEIIRFDVDWKVCFHEVPAYGRNGKDSEKNWLFLNPELCIYQPHWLISKTEGEWVKASVPWLCMDERGSCLVKTETGFTVFTHKSTLNGNTARSLDYDISAYGINGDGEVMWACQVPIVKAKELLGKDINSIGQRVIFPCGGIVQGDKYLLATGVNDARFALLTLDRKQVEP